MSSSDDHVVGDLGDCLVDGNDSEAGSQSSIVGDDGSNPLPAQRGSRGANPRRGAVFFVFCSLQVLLLDSGILSN